MAFVRSIRIAPVHNLNYHRFKDCLQKMADMAGVMTRNNEEFDRGHVYAVTVDVWAPNNDIGSVNDFCDSFLEPVRANPIGNQLTDAMSRYQERLTNWYQAEKQAQHEQKPPQGLLKRALKLFW